MPQDIEPKSLKMKSRDIAIRVRETLRDVHLKDRRDVYILTNMHAVCVE
jgi:energy-coupling factor transporter ATP-binding protein EcfA2